MIISYLKCKLGPKSSLLNSIILVTSLAIVLALSVLTDSQPVNAMPLHAANVRAIPAFARKYGLPCSACHTAWPELNNFGQTFRDNGYQLNNDHDSPIYQDPGYFPITMRITPNWHRENTNHQPIDGASGPVDARVSQGGFDLSGMDIWATGTLYKNITFSLLPSSDVHASFHFENAYIRFDNLLKSRWLNLKVGKFELDNMISEKRFLSLSANGGLYQSYHFVPSNAPVNGVAVPNDTNGFGLGNNALGMELMGHSVNSYTRYTVSVLSGNDGQTGLGSSRSYDGFATFSQAFQVGKLGLQRFGGFAYVGTRPTIPLTAGGGTIALSGTGDGNKSFYRVGFSAQLNFAKLTVLPFFIHGYDSVFLGTGTPANQPLPAGAMAPTWNGGFVETHLQLNPQFVFTQRVEKIRMSRQALPTNPLHQSDIDAYTVGYRWYPIMFSRGGLAFHNEFSLTKTQGMQPLSGAGVSSAPFGTLPVWSSSALAGFDFAF